MGHAGCVTRRLSPTYEFAPSYEQHFKVYVHVCRAGREKEIFLKPLSSVVFRKLLSPSHEHGRKVTKSQKRK